jgi:hypothetical protein
MVHFFQKIPVENPRGKKHRLWGINPKGRARPARGTFSPIHSPDGTFRIIQEASGTQRRDKFSSKEFTKAVNGVVDTWWSDTQTKVSSGDKLTKLLK